MYQRSNDKQRKMTLPAALAAALAIAICYAASSPAADDRPSTTVGMPARIEQIVLAGSQLEAKPLNDDRAPIVLRVAGVFPHGSAFRYDLVYYGLEPGQFDLRDYLRRKDGSPVDDLPPLSVEITAVLPPGQVEPNELKVRQAQNLGGYWTMLALGGIVWLAGLAAILWWIIAGFAKRRAADDGEGRRVSLADRLRPFVEDAIAGRLSLTQQAELERMLLAFWRKRLGLENMPAAEAMAVLRADTEGGSLLNQLEAWLHRPGTAGDVDVATLLAPYQDLPADEVTTN